MPRARPSGSTRLTRPMPCASAAVKRRAVKKISLAKAGPTRSIEPLDAGPGDRRCRAAPPECRSARSPTAMRRSQASATPTPPPMQKPWIMAMVGLRRCSMPRCAPACRSRRSARSPRARSGSSRIREMSAPETKALSPAPFSTMTRTAGSRSKASRISGIACHMSSDTALRRAGLLKIDPADRRRRSRRSCARSGTSSDRSFKSRRRRASRRWRLAS